MLIKIGKWHIVFLTKNENTELWNERWFSILPFRFNYKFTIQIKKRFGLKLEKGMICGENIFPPRFSKESEGKSNGN